MTLISKVVSVNELKEIMLESIINNTDKVSKVSRGTVLNGLSYGAAKIGQKAMREIALVESRKFPSAAYGSYLDQVALECGIPERYGALGSSAYIRIVAEPGTVYTKADNTFRSTSGIVFELDKTSVTIGANGFDYAKVRSTSTGEASNVDPLTINSVDNPPVGHEYVINEYKAVNGRDVESDDMLRIRIKDGANIAAKGTLASLTQAFMKINNNVLRVINYGINDNGKTVLGIISQNGADFSQEELDAIIELGEEYLSLSDLRAWGANTYGVVLSNISWYPIDLDYRAKISANYDPDMVRKDIQIRMSKYADFRFWKYYNKIEWDDLLQIVKSTPGVEYVPDTYFNPREDISIPKTMLPRMRGFIMRDMDGVIISDVSGNLNPVYFPSDPDTNYQSTILTTL